MSLGGASQISFRYHYKATPRGSASILRADFTPVNAASADKLSVFWGAPQGRCRCRCRRR